MNNILTAATVGGLLAAYYQHYGKDERKVHLLTEQKFDHAIAPTFFRAQGKIDKLARIKNRGYALVEYKTTGDSIAPDSEYWLRLKFNPQLLQYRLAAQGLGYQVDEVIYDVVRKPSIRPRQIVKTVKKKKVKTLETPEQFYERLVKDCMSRPDFYFARQEVSVLDSDVREFQAMRVSIIGQIKNLRKSNSEHAWIHNVSEQTCSFCPYKGFCLNNISTDSNNPPQGFAVMEMNPELQNEPTA